MKSVVVKSLGVSLAVEVRSGQPTTMFLHGLAGHSGEWTAVVANLSEAIGILALDQRGHGDSNAAASIDVDRSTLVSDVISVIESCARGQVHLIGQSMGGIVATLVAASRPDLVAQLILIEAGLDPMTENDFDSLRRWFATWPPTFPDHRAAVEFFGANAESTAAWVAGLRSTPTGLVARFDSGAILEVMRALASESRRTEWSSLTMPTTIIRASESVISDTDIARMVVIKPDTFVHIVDDAGHDAHLDKPEAVAAILSEAINR